MEFIKWSTILLYWIWLDIRNARENSKRHDWKLFVQILINTTVIILIIMEDRESFIRLLGQIGEFSRKIYTFMYNLFISLKTQ